MNMSSGFVVWGLAAVWLLAGCGDGTGPGVEPGEEVNLGGTWDAVALDGSGLPVYFDYPVCPGSGLPRDGRIDGATLILEDQDPDPAVPDPARLEWRESSSKCDGSGRDELLLVAWGTFLAYEDSVVFSWADPMGTRLAKRHDGLTLTVRRGSDYVVSFE